jgi:hypothetical protein
LVGMIPAKVVSQVPKSEGPFDFAQGRLWGARGSGFCGEDEFALKQILIERI